MGFPTNVEKHGDNDEKEVCNVVDKPKHGLYTVYNRNCGIADPARPLVLSKHHYT
jgi:hypothetical protein